MDTNPTPAASGPKGPDGPPASKVAKSFGVTLQGGKNEVLRFTAVRRGDGSATSYATKTIRDEEGKVKESVRGATTSHSSMEDAREHINKAVKKAQNAGWSLRRGGTVGARKPDAFDLNSLPAPRGSKK